MEHVTIYREQGRFPGWPANFGIWSWGNEIVVGFTVGHHRSVSGFHSVDETQPFTAHQARSTDGGYTWEVIKTPCKTPGNRGLSADEHVIGSLQVAECLVENDSFLPVTTPFNFSHADFALMCGRSGLEKGARSWFYASYDRCRQWEGPFSLPDFGTPGVAARTDYQVLGSRQALLFLTAAKSNGKEGRCLCAATNDGGQSFTFRSWIGDEPVGFSIMPASVRLPTGRILVAVRCNKPRLGDVPGGSWIDLYASADEGYTWELISHPVSNTGRGGNPPTLTMLRDGRLCIVYGFRGAPFGIRAKISTDQGRTWGQEIVIRADGGNHDLGYPRTTVRPDGKIVSVYYFNDSAESERYIAATIWS